jgi:hypothetical protein
VKFICIDRSHRAHSRFVFNHIRQACSHVNFAYLCNPARTLVCSDWIHFHYMACSLLIFTVHTCSVMLIGCRLVEKQQLPASVRHPNFSFAPFLCFTSTPSDYLLMLSVCPLMAHV